MSGSPVIVWFRNDLRLSDHPALHAAAELRCPVTCVYVHDETAGRPPGGASRWWLAQSLRSLKGSLRDRGADLLILRGSASREIPALARQLNASTVYWNDVAHAPHAQTAAAITEELTRDGIASRIFPGDVLAHPERTKGSSGQGPKVFTPFWRRILAAGDPPTPLPPPRSIMSGLAVAGTSVDDLGLEPRKPDWAGGLRDTWRPGEAAAQERLDDFLSTAFSTYASARDRPDQPGTSRLSPHLRFGEISPRQLWHAARFAAAQDEALAPHAEKLLSELGWREFSRHVLYYHPELCRACLRPQFEHFRWRRDNDAVAAWQRGRTGYPIVDAGMRELWHTGTMHNRVRLVAASFLVKHLLVDWRIGEAWFWDTLVDADPASNPANWQWVAGCGADAAPYFRIFNPVLQGEKFDPDGAYVRHWVPELAELPARGIHRPWALHEDELEKAGVRLGESYPLPIVEHAAARARALAAYAELRAAT